MAAGLLGIRLADEAAKLLDMCRAGNASARNAATLRTRNGEVAVIDVPFTETKEMLGGILLLEARDFSTRSR